MAIANCKRCGRIFNRIRRDICAACVVAEDRAFTAVRSYLRDHQDATLQQVASATDVGADLIISMIRDGRLILHDNPNLAYGCENCGRPTQAGRYCAACTKELAESLRTASDSLQARLATEKDGDNGGYRSR